MRFTHQIQTARERLNRLRTRLQQAQEANLNWPSTSREDLIDHLSHEIKQIEKDNQLCTQS
jgi:hypothetical protein